MEGRIFSKSSGYFSGIVYIMNSELQSDFSVSVL